MKKIIITLIVLLVLGGGYMFLDTNNTNINPSTSNTEVQNDASPTLNTNTRLPESVEKDTSMSVKDFTMTSWMDKINGKMAAHFSLKEIRVKKGDKVRITITNTAGSHDFVIDEYKLNSETPLNKAITLEFVADKVGTFEYYCSKYNHRELGQVGKLIVE